jgi:hypothetical protein
MILPTKALLAVLLIAAMIVGCGGRESSTDGSLVGSSNDSGGAQQVPGCGAICDHVIGACAPGASSSECVGDCQRTEQEFASCSGDLAAYLVCMGGTKVECRTDQIIILDCSAERNRLESCRH